MKRVLAEVSNTTSKCKKTFQACPRCISDTTQVSKSIQLPNDTSFPVINSRYRVQISERSHGFILVHDRRRRALVARTTFGFGIEK